MNTKPLPLYMTALRIAQLLGVKEGPVAAKIQELGIEPAKSINGQSYYTEENCQRLRDALLARPQSVV